MCPFCVRGRHTDCPGDRWDDDAGELLDCECYKRGHRPSDPASLELGETIKPRFYPEGVCERPDLRTRWDEPHRWPALIGLAREAGVCVRCGRRAHWVDDVVHCDCDGSTCCCMESREFKLVD